MRTDSDGRRPIPSSAGCARTVRASTSRSAEETEATAALALQGPLSRAVLEDASGESFADLRYFRRRPSTIAGVAVDISRTGYTGDLGYEIWIPTEHAVAVWDALMAAGTAYAIRPAGMLALDVVRLEAGLILLEVDYTSARHAMNPEQHYSPAEIGLGRLVNFDKGDFVGRLALEREAKAGGPARRLVGLRLDWYDIEALYDSQGLPPAISPVVDREPVPVFGGGRQVGRATSHGWSPDPQAGDRARLGAPTVRTDRDEAGGRVDGRGAARPGRGDRRRTSVPGSAPQTSLSPGRIAARRAVSAGSPARTRRGATGPPAGPSGRTRSGNGCRGTRTAIPEAGARLRTRRGRWPSHRSGRPARSVAGSRPTRPAGGPTGTGQPNRRRRRRDGRDWRR